MVKPSQVVEKRILQHLHDRRSRNQVTEIHGHFLRHGLDQSNRVLAHFVSVCGSLNKTTYARRVFDQSRNPDTSLLNSMIKAYSLRRGPHSDQSLLLFSLMKSLGLRPDPYTFAPLLKSCSNLRDYRAGQSVRAHVVRAGFERSGPVAIAVVELSASCSRMEDARKAFDEMPPRHRGEAIVWNLMVRGLCGSGDVDAGLELFRRMGERKSVVSWNSMISSLARSGRDDEALSLFGEMTGRGFDPDEATVATVLPVCARSGAVDLGRRVHSYAESRGLLGEAVSVGNSIMDFYYKCGDSESAYEVFRRMRRRDVVSWNVAISGMALNGEGPRGVRLFEEMVGSAARPNGSTFVAVLTCCGRAGLVEKGREVFGSMGRVHGVDPGLEHYGCMVDLLGRSGRVREARDLIEEMPLEPNAVLWGSLLGSCRTYGDSEIARIALEELIGLEPWNSGNYVLLSNMYAEEGRWDRVEEVRELMRERCVKKLPGQSAVV